MQMARVVGQAVSTIKHASMHGWRLLIAQPVTSDGDETGEPFLVVDSLGAGAGDHVMISSDGASTRKMMNSRTTPIRWVVIGIIDG